jgi:hypothetical protein
MATVTKTYDVFISHSTADERTARLVADSLESAGLATFHLGLVRDGERISEEVWDALAESHAVIAIVSTDIVTSANVILEIGAASAWNKPVFLLLKEVTSKRPKGMLQEYPTYPLTRLDDVIRAIQTGFEPLTSNERRILGEVYQEIGVPADQLAQSAQLLREMTKEFKRKTQKAFSGERLLSELLRLRKSGQLPRLSANRK